MRVFYIQIFISTCALFLFNGGGWQVKAQSVFPLDEAGNVLYYEVVEATGLSKEVLLDNCSRFLMEYYGLKEKKFNKQLNKKNSKVKWSESDATFTSNNVYVLYPGKFLKHAEAEISYELVIEIKDEKYRYYLHQFQHCPYELNRYGKYEPVSGKTQVFNKYFLATGLVKDREKKKVAVHLETQIELLKQYMQRTMVAPLQEGEKVIAITDEW